MRGTATIANEQVYRIRQDICLADALDAAYLDEEAERQALNPWMFDFYFG